MVLSMKWIQKRLVTQSSHGSDTAAYAAVLVVCARVCARMFVHPSFVSGEKDVVQFLCVSV